MLLLLQGSFLEEEDDIYDCVPDEVKDMMAAAAAAAEDQGDIIDEDIYDLPPEAGGYLKPGSQYYTMLRKLDARIEFILIPTWKKGNMGTEAILHHIVNLLQLRVIDYVLLLDMNIINSLTSFNLFFAYRLVVDSIIKYM